MRYLLAALFLFAGAAHAAGEGWTLTTSNVGLAGVGLTCDGLDAYTGSAKPAANTTISQKKITLSELDLSNGGIVLDRVCIKPTDVGNRASIVFGYNPDTGSDQQGDVTIRDSDIDGSAVTNNLIYATCAFRGAGSLYRNKMFGMGSGICYFGSSNVTTATIEQNYVYSLRSGMYGSPSQQSHNESATIRSFNGTSMTWKNNRLISLSGADSGSLFIQAYAGTIQNVTIEGNLLDTYGWDLPLETYGSNSYSGMKARNNRFGTSGYGCCYVTGGPGWDVWSSNYLYDENGTDGKGSAASCPAGTCASALPGPGRPRWRPAWLDWLFSYAALR